MTEENEQADVDLDEDEEETESEAEETTDWEARAKRLEEKAIAQRERTRALKVEMNKLKKAQEPKAEPKTGELDDAQLNYFDLKGYSDDDELKVFQVVMAKTGISVRQAVKDEYALNKIALLRANKAVADATPSGTKRTGSQINDVATALARFEQTGELPDDFELRSKVVNAKVEGGRNKPAWHK